MLRISRLPCRVLHSLPASTSVGTSVYSRSFCPLGIATTLIGHRRDPQAEALLQTDSVKCRVNKQKNEHLLKLPLLSIKHEAVSENQRVILRRNNTLESRSTTTNSPRTLKTVSVGYNSSSCLPLHHSCPSADSGVNPLSAVQCRQFSISTLLSGKDVTATPLPIGDASFETSSKGKWAADASTAAASGTDVSPADTPTTISQVLSDLPAQGDFASLGLGGNSPIGLVQTCLEYLHVQAGLPWWLAIISCTVVLRTLMFPLAVKVQGNAARLNNVRPEMEKLMEKMRRYNQAGNKTMAAQTTAQLFALYQKNNCNPYKMFIMPFVQIPIFVSFFIAIRRMAAVPVESMKTGGLFWFTDLTVPDPFYVLPFMACFSFIVTMELGGEAGVTNPQMDKMKTFFRAMSILLVPVTATFPTGLFMYWLTSSLFSMGQIYLLKFPAIRTRMGIPELIKHPEEEKSKKEGEGFLATVKSNYNSALLTSEARDREAHAKKRYEKMKKDPAPKLYDKPPHLR